MRSTDPGTAYPEVTPLIGRFPSGRIDPDTPWPSQPGNLCQIWVRSRKVLPDLFFKATGNWPDGCPTTRHSTFHLPLTITVLSRLIVLDTARAVPGLSGWVASPALASPRGVLPRFRNIDLIPFRDTRVTVPLRTD